MVPTGLLTESSMVAASQVCYKKHNQIRPFEGNGKYVRAADWWTVAVKRIPVSGCAGVRGDASSDKTADTRECPLAVTGLLVDQRAGIWGLHQSLRACEQGSLPWACMVAGTVPLGRL